MSPNHGEVFLSAMSPSMSHSIDHFPSAFSPSSLPPSSVSSASPSPAVDPRTRWSLLDLNQELDSIEQALKAAGRNVSGTPTGIQGRTLEAESSSLPAYTPLFEMPEYASMRQSLQERSMKNGSASKIPTEQQWLQSPVPENGSPDSGRVRSSPLVSQGTGSGLRGTPFASGGTESRVRGTPLVSESTGSGLRGSPLVPEGASPSSSQSSSWKKSSFEARRPLTARKAKVSSLRHSHLAGSGGRDLREGDSLRYSSSQGLELLPTEGEGSTQRGNTQAGITQKGSAQKGSTQEGSAQRGNTQEGVAQMGSSQRPFMGGKGSLGFKSEGRLVLEGEVEEDASANGWGLRGTEESAGAFGDAGERGGEREEDVRTGGQQRRGEHVSSGGRQGREEDVSGGGQQGREEGVNIGEQQGREEGVSGGGQQGGGNQWETMKAEARMMELESARQRRVQEAMREKHSVLNRALLEEEVRMREKEREVEKVLGVFEGMVEEEMVRQDEALKAYRDMYGSNIAAVKEAAEEAALVAFQAAEEKRKEKEREERESQMQREEEERKRRVLEEERRRQELEQQLLKQQQQQQQQMLQAQKIQQELQLKQQEAMRLKAEQEKQEARKQEEAAKLRQQQQEQKQKQELLLQQQQQQQKLKETPPWMVVKGTREGVEFRAKGSHDLLSLAREREQQWLQWEKEAEPFKNDPSRKRERKDIERTMVKLVQQISATQDQVRAKSTEIVQVFRNARGMPAPFLLLAFAEKVLAQVQANQLPTAAFAVAQVIVNVSASIEGVMEAVLCCLNKACIFTVPKSYALHMRDSATEADTDEYMRVCGYKEDGGKLETTDQFVERIVGCVTLMGALLQATPSGSYDAAPRMGAGWQWCAALLNHLPANRMSATALEAFLKVAGHGMHEKYPRPFRKLMRTVYDQYIAQLRDLRDPDVSPVVTRLAMYIESAAFEKSPEGRQMPRSDISSSLRA